MYAPTWGGNDKWQDGETMNWGIVTVVGVGVMLVACCILPMLFMRRHSARDNKCCGKPISKQT